MPGKCAKCVIAFASADIVAKCSECKLEFHPACTRVGQSQFTKTKNKNWPCDSCFEKTGASASSQTPEEIGDEKKSILEAIKSVKSEIVSTVEKKIDELKSSVNCLSEDIRSLKTEVKTLRDAQGELNQRCSALELDNKRLLEDVRDLTFQLRDVEQHSRSANLELVGVPQTQGEDVYLILARTASAIGVDYKPGDVSIAHRLRLYSQRHAHAPIIIQFTARVVREKWLAAVRAKKSLTASEIAASFPATSVYVNEHLTPANKALLGKARRLRRERKLHYAGYANGKVLVKPREDDAAIRVLEMEDLDKYQ